MALTPKQAAQVAKAPADKRQALRAGYMAQNAGAAPSQKKQSKPAARAPRRTRGGQGPKGVTNFLDPMCPVPAPAVVSDGKALPHTGLVSGDFVVGTVNTTVLLVTNTGDSGTVGLLANVDSEGVYVEPPVTFTVPTLAAADSAGGPSASRAMKFSVSVTNCSNALKRGGRVTYLNSSQRLPALVDGLDYTDVIGAIKSSPYRRRITGDILGRPSHLIGYPVDNTAYAAFSPHQGTLTPTEFTRYVLGASALNSPAHRPMSIVAYVFDPVGDPQDYSVTIRASYYTRWPLTSVPGHQMRNMPTADAKLINHVRDSAEANANDLAHIVEGGAIATVAPRVAGVARTAVGRAVSRVGGLFGRGAASAVEAAEGLAADTIGADAAALLTEGAMVML